MNTVAVPDYTLGDERFHSANFLPRSRIQYLTELLETILRWIVP